MSALERQPSMQTRLLLLVLAFATMVWLVAASLTWIGARQEVDELLDSHLAQGAALLLLQAGGDLDDVAETPVLQKYAPDVAFQVYLGDELVTRSANMDTVPLSTKPEGFSTVRREDGTRWRVVSIQTDRTGGHHGHRHGERSADAGSDGPGVTVMLGEKLESRQAILWALIRGLAWPALAALPLFGLGLWWAVRRGLAPIRALRDMLEQRAPHTAEPVSLGGMPRELVPLVQTLNDLLARIDCMVQIERRFTADAAHELRTPIAAIRAQAQVAMGAGDDVAERTHALQTTLAGCDRASHLVDQLLTLARLEVAPDAKPAPVDLVAVVRRVAGELAPAALVRQQEITLLADAPCAVAASEALLGVLVRNLLDNALRYSPPGARVELAVRSDATGVQLQVQDSGPGMSEEAIGHLGERFFRVLGSDQPGSGLGWSIVRRLLAVFGASAQITRSPQLGGLSVAVHWPAAP